MLLKDLWRLLGNAFIHKKSAPDILLLPSTALSYLLIIFAAIFTLGCSFPKDGITIFPNITFSFPGIAEWLNYNNKAEAIDYFTINLQTGGFLNQTGGHGRMVRSALPAKCTPADIKALPVQPIEYPAGKNNVLSPMWKAFKNAPNKSKTPMRILHYGDSQLEADRISYFLRTQFQQRFGGGGIGFVPLNPVIPVNPTVNMTMSSGWEYSTALVKEEQRNPKPVGHLLSNAVLPANISNAWIKIDRRTLKAYPPLRFTQIKLLFSNYDAERVIEICTPTQTLHRQIAFPESSVQEIVANVGNTHEPITIKVQGSGRITLYGVAMDYNNGIALDNIPLRASAGLDFVKADVNVLKQCYKELNVKLIILQFGVNVVPHQTTNYKYYENQIYKQLKQLQMAASYTPILVVGVSDIARRNANGVWASYPNVEKVRDAQRNAAFRANCAFWDTYQAMGGENSIISWASARPALATKDFCHFSPNGIQLLSELLYRSLMDDFVTYYTAK